MKALIVALIVMGSCFVGVPKAEAQLITTYKWMSSVKSKTCWYIDFICQNVVASSSQQAVNDKCEGYQYGGYITNFSLDSWYSNGKWYAKSVGKCIYSYYTG